MVSDVAVVILNWNGRTFLERFLGTVIKHSQGFAEVIVADNASTDDSVSYLESHFPDTRIIRNDKNYGFAEGYNQALKLVDAKYYVLLNSDIEVTENWIKPVIDLMETDPNIAACQPKLRSFHEPQKFEYAGAAGGYIDKYGYPFCRGRIFQDIETDEGQYDDACEVFWATGACLFVRAEVYHRLEGLDREFFAHMEEIDFCWRAKNEGYRIMYCPGSTVYHVGGGTLPKSSWKKTYLNMRNNNMMLFKNLPTKKIKRVFAARFFLDLMAAGKFLVDGGFYDFFAVIRAHFSFARRVNYLLRERAKYHHRKVSCIYRKNIVFQHYLSHKHKFTELDKNDFS